MARDPYTRHNAGKTPKRIIGSITLIVLTFLSWAALSPLDEVAIGQGRVIPSSQTQAVQSVQGGRVVELLVAEGDIVEQGQLLAILDTTRVDAELAEVEAGLYDGGAQKQLLIALLADQDGLVLTGDPAGDANLVAQKTALFDDVRLSHIQAMQDLQNELDLLQQEMAIFQRASDLGGGTEIERLRLSQKIASTQTRLNNQRQNYKSELQLELNDVNLKVQQLTIRLQALKELVVGNELRSPRRGVVQEIFVSTAGGGVLPPNGSVMDIVPIEDRLLIEARFSPRDIAFIAPGQTARIKVTAYDFSIYGDLEAEVLRVSPDSFQDELANGQYYFAVTLESKSTFFESANGNQLSIIPGMVTTTEVLTGNRTVLQYLLKPLNKAGEALRER